MTEVSQTLSIAVTSFSNGNLELTWTSDPGKTNVVQYKNNISDVDWIDVSVPAGATSIEISTTNASARYYRIKQGN